jgi:hypothetical protein
VCAVVTRRLGAVQNRNYAGQKLPVAAVEAAETVAHDGVTYYVYETAQQGSPTLYDMSSTTLRVGKCVTAVRPGLSGTPYLYTLALTCPSPKYPELEAPFRDCAESFRLLPPDDSYIAPDKDPWNIF